MTKPENARPVQERETRLASLDASMERGMDDAKEGRFRPATDVFDRLAGKYRVMFTDAE